MEIRRSDISGNVVRGFSRRRLASSLYSCSAPCRNPFLRPKFWPPPKLRKGVGLGRGGEERAEEEHTACVTEVDDQLRHTMAYANDVKLFGKWSYDEIEVRITTRAREHRGCRSKSEERENSPPSVGALRRGGGEGVPAFSCSRTAVAKGEGRVSRWARSRWAPLVLAGNASGRNRRASGPGFVESRARGHPPFPYFFFRLRGANLFF